MAFGFYLLCKGVEIISRTYIYLIIRIMVILFIVLFIDNAYEQYTREMKSFRLEEAFFSNLKVSIMGIFLGILLVNKDFYVWKKLKINLLSFSFSIILILFSIFPVNLLSILLGLDISIFFAPLHFLHTHIILQIIAGVIFTRSFN